MSVSDFPGINQELNGVYKVQDDLHNEVHLYKNANNYYAYKNDEGHWVFNTDFGNGSWFSILHQTKNCTATETGDKQYWDRILAKTVELTATKELFRPDTGGYLF